MVILKYILLLIILIYISYLDIKTRKVQNIFSFFIILIGIIDINIYNILLMILNALLSALPLLLSNVAKKSSFGGADIKILSSIGFAIGLIDTLSLLSIAVILDFLYRKIKKEDKPMPFIPFILIGYIVILIIKIIIKY